MSESKLINVPIEFHSYMKQLSDDKGVTMIRIIENMVLPFLLKSDWDKEADWKGEKEAQDDSKPTWTKVVSRIESYMTKYPGADTEKLMSHTGYSKAQVETVTMVAHKRCINYLTDNPEATPKELSTECAVSLGLAKRVAGQYRGDGVITKRERHLYQ